MQFAAKLETLMAERISLPVLALRDTIVFPGIATPVTVGRLKTLRAVEVALRAADEDKRVFAVGQREEADEPTPEALWSVGVVARIIQVQRMGIGLQVVMYCEHRAASIRYTERDGVITGTTLDLDDTPVPPSREAIVAALAREVRDRSLEYGRLRGAPDDVLKPFLGALDDVSALANHVAFYLDVSAAEKQTLLETLSVEERLRQLASLVTKQIGILKTQERIRSSVQDQFDERQRELFLREQLRAIQKELGDEDETNPIERLAEKIRRLELPGEASHEVERELGRLRRMGREGSPEVHVLTTWLEWVAELPWNRRTDDHVDLPEAEEILENDHYGLGDVKNRVLEFLAVRKLLVDRALEAGARARAMSRGPILLFVGPPGTGKTSIAESIARALGRKYVRVSLGGARDEADIRGHRRTYVGAMPGRILQGMRRAGCKNPVFTLDEIDKLGTSFHGDPGAALLEALDPAQNSQFVDHYLGVPFDLSEALFVCTANVRDTIPPALLDRMEAIVFAGYTEAEKLEIARRYLVPRQRRENGLRDEELLLADDAIRQLVMGYTREAGVRELEREIGAVSRKVARKIASGGTPMACISGPEQVRELLGRPRTRPERALDRDEPGVATGMYYTHAGGDIMFVEATLIRGRGELVLTGQLGDVMKESARAALSYARTRSPALGVTTDRTGRDVHVHVPAGAIPKDGPSAGVAMVVALMSALLGRPVRRNVAMTGEITLRGRVLPVGGLKEKILGAHRAQIPELIIPSDNEADLDDLPADILGAFRVHLVETLEQAIEIALQPSQAMLRAG